MAQLLARAEGVSLRCGGHGRCRMKVSKAKFLAVWIVSTGAVALLALSLAGAVPGLQSDEKGGGTYDGSRFLTSARDRLSICVDSSRLSADAAEVAQSQGELAIEAAIAELAATHPGWAKEDFSNPAPVVDTGCPVEPALYDPERGPERGDLYTVIGRTVSEASRYRVHVYILPEDEITRYVGQSGYRVTTEELMWIDVDVLFPVTSGVYLSPSDLRDTTLVRESLDDAIGLEADR